MRVYRAAETGNLSEAISAFEKLGDFELSSEYIALCKTYEGLCSHWVRVNYIHDKYGKNPPPNITIVTAPQRNGETLYKANGNNAILQGDVLSFCEDKIYKYKFDLSTGVLQLEGVERSYASYKRIDNS